MDSSKIKLTFLLLIAALPITLATWFYGLREMQGISVTSNKGVLIVPVLDITALAMHDDAGEPIFQTFEDAVAGVSAKEYQPRPWLLVYLGGPDCDSACAQRLYFLRQLHRRLGREVDRVARYHVNVTQDRRSLTEATRTLFAEQFPELGQASADRDTLLKNLAGSLPADVDPVTEHYIYVVDPVGNVMLYFTPENTPEDILRDLDRLLDQSSLG
ncbi:MAG: hypothetical protein RQ899_07165 [Pseudomonadales bacterium]|nr:hypothetical protein [Pseudomonadales bacterium]